ncbi:ABC transporter substrate-binding protein, partial [Parabacteroides distasonis]|uniref:ABC transporter substrate-binding protein n=1 Tax=Parabacteroides distasonis TaxID=823 RepID=UPI001323F573
KIIILLLIILFICITSVIILIAHNNNNIKDVSKQKEELIITGMLHQSRNYFGLKKMVEKLKIEENITIDFQVIPDEQFDTLMQMKIKAGKAPDIIDYNVPRVYGSIDPLEHLADLSNEPWINKLKNIDTLKYTDGKMYSFPLQDNSGISGIIYNKKLFEKYDIKIPRTSKQFEDVCKYLITQGITPILMCKENWVPQMWMNYGYSQALGSGEKCEEMSKKILKGEKKFSDYQELAEVIDYYVSMFKKGYVNNDYLTVTYTDMLKRLTTGEGAMILGYSEMISTIQRVDRTADIGIFNAPFDYNKNDLLVCPRFSIGFVASKDSENLETVKKVFNLWSKPEYLNLWFKDNPGFPAFILVDGGNVNADVINLYEKYKKQNKIIYESMSYLEPIQPLNSTILWPYYLEAPKEDITGEELLSRFQLDLDKYLGKTKKIYDGN